MAIDLTLTDNDLQQLRTGPLTLDVSDVPFRVEGPAAIECLQGLLTNDVAKCAVQQAVWGAFLTPKGMIISDAWVLRDAAGAWVVVPAIAYDAMHQLFARTIPPRLAKVRDARGTHHVRWQRGAIQDETGFAPRDIAPFDRINVVERSSLDAAPQHAETLASALRLAGGWPTLGREIDERTLPQEVRFDELSGVRYDKGCYTGQETVARLHFRGHANRGIRGVVLNGQDDPTTRDVHYEGKSVGSLRTVAKFGERVLALAMVRREVPEAAELMLGDQAARLVELPFAREYIEVA